MAVRYARALSTNYNSIRRARVDLYTNEMLQIADMWEAFFEGEFFGMGFLLTLAERYCTARESAPSA